MTGRVRNRGDSAGGLCGGGGEGGAVASGPEEGLVGAPTLPPRCSSVTSTMTAPTMTGLGCGSGSRFGGRGRAAVRTASIALTTLAVLTVSTGAVRPAAFVAPRAGGVGRILSGRGDMMTSTSIPSTSSRSVLFQRGGRERWARRVAPRPSAFFPSSSSSSSLSAEAQQEMSEQEQQPDTPSGGDEDGEWHTLVSAFRMYKAAYGDLKVPSRFVVPAMAPWPETAWQLKLGQRVAAIRSTGRYVQNSESRRKALDDMGFLWRLRAPSPGGRTAGDGSKGGAIKLDEDGVTFDQVYDALKTYRQSVQPGTEPLNVPPSYEVPDCEPWPSSTRGLPLGKLIPSVRSKSYLKSRPGAREKLAELGFVFDGKAAANDLRYRRVFDALVRYKEIYGDLLVPQPFSIPETGAEDDEGEIWPDDVRGLRLGARVNAIRSQGTFVKSDPDRREQLDELGFVWEPPANADGKRRGRKRKVDEEDGEGGYEDGAAGASLMEGLTTPYGAPSGLADAGLSTPPAFSAGGDPFANMERGGGSPQWAFEGQDDIAALEEEEKDRKSVV